MLEWVEISVRFYRQKMCVYQTYSVSYRIRQPRLKIVLQKNKTKPDSR